MEFTPRRTMATRFVARLPTRSTIDVDPSLRAIDVSDKPLEFPPLNLPAIDAWEWPRPPFAWRYSAADHADAAQPCRIETGIGKRLDGLLIEMDPALGVLRYRARADGEPIALPFTRFMRLTLTTPLRPPAPLAGAPAERVPAAAQQREYRLQPADGADAPLTGRTAGYVQADEGLYLFPPADDGRSLQRVFVPRWACAEAHFGASAQEIAAANWVAEPAQLLAAIERQRRMPVLPIGQSLLALGMVTQEQLEHALAQQRGDVPLGEMLVADGIISRWDLRTALAHKMGYPFVDLTRFPVDPAAAKKLTLRTAVESRALPVMLDGTRLIVVVDRPARTTRLRGLRAFSQLGIVPVLASRMQILDALTRLSKQDVWADHVAVSFGHFDTTI
jgi:hypothetical protein